MHIISTLLLGFLFLAIDALIGLVQSMHQWMSGCLISVVLLLAVVGGIASVIMLGGFFFNL